MQACLRRLEAATSTFQVRGGARAGGQPGPRPAVMRSTRARAGSRPRALPSMVARRPTPPAGLSQLVPGEGEFVTRPLKVEEGLLLSVLEAAANKGHVPLAEAAWRLLERSLALPNPPSTRGALSVHLGRAHQLQQEEAEEAEEAEGLLDAEAAAGGSAAALPNQLEEELEAAQVGAAEVAEASLQQQRQQEKGGGERRQGRLPLAASDWSELAREEAQAMAAQPRGVRAPSLPSHLALVHAYARAGELEGMFRAVNRMEEVSSPAGWSAGKGSVCGGGGVVGVCEGYAKVFNGRSGCSGVVASWLAMLRPIAGAAAAGDPAQHPPHAPSPRHACWEACHQSVGSHPAATPRPRPAGLP